MPINLTPTYSIAELRNSKSWSKTARFVQEIDWQNVVKERDELAEALKRLLSPMTVHDKYCEQGDECDCAQGQARAALANLDESQDEEERKPR